MDVKRLRELAGCTRTCMLTALEDTASPRLRVTHNGVSFSRKAAVDMYLVRTNEAAVEQVLAAWMQAHHRGDTSAPFSYEIEPGRFVLVPEAVI